MTSKNDELVYFNGLNGSTGCYGVPPMSRKDLARCVRGETDPEFLKQLEAKHERNTAGLAAPVTEGVDAWDLAQAGWGIVFRRDDPDTPAIRDALSELLTLREEQAGDRFRIFEGEDGYHPGDSLRVFLRRHGVRNDLVDPERGVPYYLLLVGSPEEISYGFQYQLDVQFAVGRIFFQDIESYANYARSVVASEAAPPRENPRLSLFGVVNPDDWQTEVSAKHLIRPLRERLEAQVSEGQVPAWSVETVVGEDATKTRLARWLGGDRTPDLLMTAGHGMLFNAESDRLKRHQGALVCREWPGPKEWKGGRIPEEHYFSADDVPDDAELGGLITFHFACFSAGTPLHEDFSLKEGVREKIAPHPFLAGLPTRLLGHPNGGALACIGHVDMTFQESFKLKGGGEQTTAFAGVLARLMKGFPVGYAFELFDLRYAGLAAEMGEVLREREYVPDSISDEELTDLWTDYSDARNYVVLGDPAVRLPREEQ